MRSIIFGLLVLALSGSNAFASCSSEDATCTSMCVVSSALTKQFGGGNECINNCLNAANACEAREDQQRQMEQQRQQMQQQQQAQQQQQQQQAAERQAQQERDAKEIGGKQQRVQQANEVAQRVGAEAAIQQQFDAAMEKGMQAIDQKGYVSAEYQFKAALKIRPTDVDAKAGLLRAIMGSGRRAAAITYANEQLLALAAQPPGSNGQSTYAHWLEVLNDYGLANDVERSQLERIYPFGSGDPERAATGFLQSNPKSAFIPFVRQIGAIMPAMRADYADRRKVAALREEQKLAAERERLKAEVEARAEAEAKVAVVDQRRHVPAIVIVAPRANNYEWSGCAVTDMLFGKCDNVFTEQKIDFGRVVQHELPLNLRRSFSVVHIVPTKQEGLKLVELGVFVQVDIINVNADLKNNLFGCCDGKVEMTIKLVVENGEHEVWQKTIEMSESVKAHRDTYKQETEAALTKLLTTGIERSVRLFLEDPTAVNFRR